MVVVIISGDIRYHRTLNDTMVENSFLLVSMMRIMQKIRDSRRFDVEAAASSAILDNLLTSDSILLVLLSVLLVLLSILLSNLKTSFNHR